MAEGLFSELFNAIDSAKRGVANRFNMLVDNPREYAAQIEERARDFRRAQEAGIPGMAAQITGRPVTPEQQRAQQYAEQQMMDVAMGFAGPTAYHVSPKLFSKFDPSKAGSGLGSLRGEGTYLSATPEASVGYAKQMQNPTFYKVDLPDKIAKDFLNWDKPVPSNLYKKANEAAVKQFGSGLDDISGSAFYNSVVSNFEKLGSKNPVADASSWFNAQGIKGMEYQTGKAGERKNYVVYDPSVLTILEKGQKPFTPLDYRDPFAPTF